MKTKRANHRCTQMDTDAEARSAVTDRRYRGTATRVGVEGLFWTTVPNVAPRRGNIGLIDSTPLALGGPTVIGRRYSRRTSQRNVPTRQEARFGGTGSWACARRTRFSPSYHMTGFQPCTRGGAPRAETTLANRKQLYPTLNNNKRH